MKQNDQLLKLERRVNVLEKEIEKYRASTSHNVSFEKRMNDVKQASQEKRKKILLKTGGVLANLNIDPVKWQKKIRKEWDERFEREVKT